MIPLPFVLAVQGILLVLAHANSISQPRDDPDSIQFNSIELQDPQQLEESANIMFDEYWQIVMQDDPEYATVLGDHRYDDRLNSYSFKCYEKKKVMMNEFLERATQMLSLAREGTKTHFNLQLFITNLQFKLDFLMSGSHLFPISNLFTPQMELREILGYTKINNEEQAWNLIKRYRAVPKQIDEQIELMREGIRTNLTLHDISIFSTSGNWNQSIENSPFYEPFLNISESISVEDL
ncbi:uncharacterized protein CEXT_573701 [Caerostris extrusa]|uniref:Uncharacterized protein n=1 Tax=Caerostris extrusa TaxID=172846 RepID=A0AAV4YD82_CAEEX|nr:uncharacterized protein CEXT_573701 [Caerostris extrusa]